MNSWSSPNLPVVPGESPPLRLFDTASGGPVEISPEGTARMYVCGITPYDATHLGHAATYVTFDLVNRALRAGGHPVHYVQNTTDIDDPLLERAERDGIDWRNLAHSEIDLFRSDMTALRVIPPQDYVGVVETMPQHAATVDRLLASGAAYALPVKDEGALDGAQDVYLDLSQQPSFGAVSHWDRAQMLEVYAERGGDPDRVGKRDVLDPLLWRGARADEPSWPGPQTGPGRPGWHIECTTFTHNLLGNAFDVQGGGTDLIFPHHEMSAVQAAALTGETPYARAYAHQAMVAFDGEKMSKSKGNLVRVSTLLQQDVDPMVIRLVLLAQHYRTPWEYTDGLLAQAQQRLAQWRSAFGPEVGDDALVSAIRARLADDLDTVGALADIDAWLAGGGCATGGALVRDALDALLGVAL